MKHTKMKHTRLCFIVIVCILLCLPVSVTAQASSKYTVKVKKGGGKTSISVPVKSKTALRVVSGSRTVKPSKAKFKSSKPKIVSVSSDGILTAKKSGSAVITVKYGKKSAKIKVTVIVPVSSVKLKESAVTLEGKGQKVQLKATVKPQKATNKEIKWKSSDETVATVNAKGEVTAVNNGKAVITAVSKQNKKITAKCKVTVRIAASAVLLNRYTLNLKPDSSMELTAVVWPLNTVKNAVKWSSSDPEVAKVSADGTVTGVKAGTAEITAESVNGKTAVCTVTVYEETATVNEAESMGEETDRSEEEMMKDPSETSDTEQNGEGQKEEPTEEQTEEQTEVQTEMQTEEPTEEQPQLRILMLGNSFTYYNDMPSTLAELTGATVVAYTKGGAWLSDQLDPTTSFGARTLAALENQHWDYVILQENSCGPVIAKQEFFSSVSALCEMSRRAGATPVLYATWAYQKGSAKLREMDMDYDEMASLLSAAYHEAGRRYGALTADVGEQFYMRSPGVNLYNADGYHPNALGSRLAAEVLANEINKDYRM